MMDAGGPATPEGKFIVVREDRGVSSSTETHSYKANAQAEAERLVRKENRAFTVYELKVVGVCRPADMPVKWEAPQA